MHAPCVYLGRPTACTSRRSRSPSSSGVIRRAPTSAASTAILGFRGRRRCAMRAMAGARHAHAMHWCICHAHAIDHRRQARRAGGQRGRRGVRARVGERAERNALQAPRRAHLAVPRDVRPPSRTGRLRPTADRRRAGRRVRDCPRGSGSISRPSDENR